MDKIVIPQIPVRVRVGVTEEERSEDQDILIDVELGLDLRPAGTTDDLTQTVDYEAVCAAVATTINVRLFSLIETIGEEIADMILKEYPIDQVLVRVRKPGALQTYGVPYAATEILRCRDG
ncbi:MAG: dihydroneopterin aldolase [Gemmatimonadota bacterium]|nr:dihydroneopterin aldolase [Gemmatimonadota bacterium]|tara:strand:+ start:2520 stop:2882 length:363 start_codon:yes stop_codon:yes gene_type:complete